MVFLHPPKPVCLTQFTKCKGESVKMDVKTFAKYFILGGVTLLVMGGIQFITNQPLKFEPSPSVSSSQGDWMSQQMAGINRMFTDMSRSVDVSVKNMERDDRRAAAALLIAVGGFVLFIGSALYASAKPKESAPLVEQVKGKEVKDNVEG